MRGLLAALYLLAACSIDLAPLQRQPAELGEPDPAINPDAAAAGSGGDTAGAGTPSATVAGTSGQAAAGAGGTTPRRTCGVVGLPCCMPGNTCDLGACLRGKCTAYGGFYARKDGCTQNPCSSRNAYTAGCSCPMGFDDTLLWQRSESCDTGDATTDVRSCTAARTPETTFGGVWVQGPDSSCKLGCRTPNPLSDTCACPEGTRALALTVDSVDAKCPDSALTLNVCIHAGGMPLNFGGAYALSQRAALGCSAPNPLTGACSCPPDANTPQSLHVGSWSVFVCNL
jgi:hypothetical protein